MTKIVEGHHPGSCIVGEVENVFFYCREAATVAENQELSANQVVGKLTAGGETVAFDPAGLDGSQEVDGIMFAGCVTGAGETKQATVLVRGPLTVRGSDLVWPDGITDPQKVAAIGDLNDKHIVVTPLDLPPVMTMAETAAEGRGESVERDGKGIAVKTPKEWRDESPKLYKGGGQMDSADPGRTEPGKATRRVDMETESGLDPAQKDEGSTDSTRSHPGGSPAQAATRGKEPEKPAADQRRAADANKRDADK